MACQTTLPASWYTSKAIYGLERRAIFLKVCSFSVLRLGESSNVYKSWILLGAVTKWPNAQQDYGCELAQVNYTIRRSSPDWKTIKIFSDSVGLI